MKSKFVHSSVVSPSSVASIISEPIGWLSLKFWFLLPLGHMTVRVLKKKKDFYEYFLFSLEREPKLQKATPPSNHSLNLLKPFLNFLLRSPHKNTVLDF